MSRVNYFKVNNGHLIMYPQLSSQNLNKFIVRDTADLHLITECETEREAQNLVAAVNDSAE